MDTKNCLGAYLHSRRPNIVAVPIYDRGGPVRLVVYVRTCEEISHLENHFISKDNKKKDVYILFLNEIHSIQTKQLQEDHFISKRNKALFIFTAQPSYQFSFIVSQKQRHTFHRKVVNEDLS